MEFELQSFDQRLGKFEGVQQQHDQRLAAIEQRLGTIEVLVRGIPAEGHREREALRTALTHEREELTNKIRTEVHQARDELINKIDGLRTELTIQLESYRREVAANHVELNRRIDLLSNKIDGLYKWIIGTLIAVGVSVIASLLKGIF